VTSVSRLEELEKPVDLVMLAHVLEHVSDPVALSTELTTAVGDGGYLYVEVPERGGWHAVAQKQYDHSTGLLGLSVFGVLATREVPATEPPAGQGSP
jgi:hypothetical protein